MSPKCGSRGANFSRNVWRRDSHPMWGATPCPAGFGVKGLLRKRKISRIDKIRKLGVFREKF